jgi:hypothetical protein
MEAAFSSEIWMNINKTERCNIPENYNFFLFTTTFITANHRKTVMLPVEFSTGMKLGFLFPLLPHYTRRPKRFQPHLSGTLSESEDVYVMTLGAM